METQVVDRRKMLKVKLKALAAEARIIRFEELRTKGPLRDELCWHRRWVVRREARITHLAYSFLRGRPYLTVEAKCDIPPDWKRVEGMIKKYGPLEDLSERFKKWQEQSTHQEAA